MLFRNYILIFFIFSALWAYADDLESDTIRLRGMTIHGDYYERFSAGSILLHADSMDKQALQANNLNDLLSKRNPIYFKTYGNGMLTSISFRGTGASHTAVLWNGVNINQPTLGQSDFSLFPVLAFDQVRVVYGSTSSRFGSDAIGGSILMESVPDWGKTLSGNIGQYLGSYGNFLSTIRLQMKAGDHVLLSSKFYRHRSENDFEFSNITRPGTPVERQQNASYFRYGFLQDIFINTTKNSQLAIKSWFNFSDREIQPTMIDQDADESQKDKSLRLVADYGLSSPIGYFALKGAYIWDYMMYDNLSEIITRQHIGQIDYENRINGWEIKVGSNFNHIRAEVDNYEDGTTENRTDVYGGLVNHDLKNTQLSLNIRSTFVKGYNAPISPSIGARYEFINSKKTLWYVTGQAAMNYKVPTLNDRYWIPGGRKDLLPEKSKNLDASMGYTHSGKVRFEISLAAHYYNVDNWILWIPGPSYWVPENVRKVEAYGFEVFANIELKTGIFLSEWHANYGFTRSVIKASAMEDDVGINHQLPYTPVSMAGMEYWGTFKNWSGSLAARYTGNRYVTSDNESTLPSYWLLDLRAGRDIQIRKQLLVVDFRINNILNTSYQNMRFRAMPGRNYMVGINFMFNKL